jgi:hypothetical protein
MNAKHFGILAIITLAVIIAAVMLTPPKTTTPETKKLFPQLSEVLNDITQISVTNKGETVTLERDENWLWRLKEKHHYPVAVKKAHNLLLGLADLTVLEGKTSNPERYAQLGVEDVSENNAQSSLLTFQTAAGKTVASLIVGNDSIAKIDSTRREIYIRKPNQKKTWLTLGRLPIEKEATDWLDQEIVDLDSDNIRNISVTHSDGEQLVIFKDAPEDEEFQLADLPENATVKFPYMLRNMATTLTRLNLDDVTTASSFTFDEEATTRAVFTTFDGLEITMTTIKKDGKHYASFAAAFNSDAVYQAPPTEETSEDEEMSLSEEDEEAPFEEESATDEEEAEPVDVKKQAEQLNAKFEGWVYELSQYKVDDLNKKRDDLISLEDSADNEPDDQTGTLPAIDMDNLNLPNEFGTPSTTTDFPMFTPLVP